MKQLTLLIALILFLALTAQSQTKEIKKPEPTAQCKAVTQKGTQCSRKAVKGSTLCWQHKKMKDEGKKVKQLTKE